MAEHNDSPEGAPDAPEVGLDRRARFGWLAKKTSGEDAVDVRRGKLDRAGTGSPRATPQRRPLRSLFTIAAVTGLVATVAIPAYAAWQPEQATTTMQQLAEEGAQTLVIASDVETDDMARDSYAATTPEEIAERKAVEAAEARARAAAAAAASSGSVSALPAGVPLVAPGSGLVRRPLPYFNNFGTDYAGHRGTDYMVERGTPIYSVADGVVVSSTDGGGALGVFVAIAHNINGTAVETTYAHMVPGSRTVSVGDSVSVGQMIGQVSDTGLAFGTHLHLMIKVNGAVVNAEGWLVANT